MRSLISDLSPLALSRTVYILSFLVVHKSYISQANAFVLFTAKSLRVIDVIPAALLPTKVILPFSMGSGTTPSSSPRPIEVAYPF